jgi:transposase
VTDLRKGFNGLLALIQYSLNRDPLSGSEAFVFCNRRRDTVKIFFAERDRTGDALKRD